jgi:ubiquinone/menaquinone biosynthesis C-methylase UbiE
MTKSGGWSTVQEDWQSPLHGEAWGQGLDNGFLMQRLWNLPAEVVLRGKKGRVLDVAAAGAVHSTDIASHGFTSIALEPAPTMLAAARQRILETGTNVQLVQAFAETLPFRDESFDQVLCHSAIDHFAEPDRCIREMTRVLRADGRLSLTFVNYGSISTRLSRTFYRVDALFRSKPRVPHWFWESPVPHEHSFECTMPVVAEMCEQYLTLEEAFGVSIGWQMPGWGWLLERVRPLANPVLSGLDEIARRFPAAADLVVAVWRPKPRRAWRAHVPAFATPPGDREELEAVRTESLRVTGADPVYRRLIGQELEPRSRWVDLPVFASILEGYGRMSNRQITGDPERSWIDDLVQRGNAGRSAVLGIDGTFGLETWQGAVRGRRTEVFDLNPAVLRETEHVLAQHGLAAGVRFHEADLNFLRLKSDSYDVIWTSGCLHHVINLEHVLEQIDRALTGGGLFAVYDYIGEQRRRFSLYRLAKINALLKEVPVRFRRGAIEEIEAPHPQEVGPFCSARSDDIPALLAEQFEPVHEVTVGHFYPIELYLDIQRMEVEEPSWIDRLLEAEAAARDDRLHTACMLYGVYRKKV